MYEWYLNGKKSTDVAYFNSGIVPQFKARQVYLYTTFHTQCLFKVLYIEYTKIIKRNKNN